MENLGFNTRFEDGGLETGVEVTCGGTFFEKKASPAPPQKSFKS
jgi:hypothetical protein